MSNFLSHIPFIKKTYRFLLRIRLEKARKLRLLKTLWFNIRFLPWKQAKHFPVFIHGTLTVYRGGGTICLNIPLERLRPGLIRLGYDYDRFSCNQGGTLLQLVGAIRWKGPFRSSVNAVIGACQPGATVEFGQYVSVGANTSIRSYRSIIIEDHVAITHDSSIYDTDFHPFRNILTGQISQYMVPVKIGQGSFIGSGTQISKGTVLPPYSLVASRSLLNRDYSQEGLEAPFIAGMPGKIKSHGFVRIFEKDLEITAMKHFMNNNSSLAAHKGIPSDHSGRKGAFI